MLSDQTRNEDRTVIPDTPDVYDEEALAAVAAALAPEELAEGRKLAKSSLSSRFLIPSQPPARPSQTACQTNKKQTKLQFKKVISKCICQF